MTSKKIHSNLHTFVNKLPVIISKKSVLDFKQITKSHVRLGVKRGIIRISHMFNILFLYRFKLLRT